MISISAFQPQLFSDSVITAKWRRKQSFTKETNTVTARVALKCIRCTNIRVYALRHCMLFSQLPTIAMHLAGCFNFDFKWDSIADVYMYVQVSFKSKQIPLYF